MEFVKRINIQNFGSYTNFIWKNSVKNKSNEVEDFRKLNIIYGRNYSGKTTLSRIFRAFETASLPNKITTPEFQILTDNVTLNQNDIDKSEFDIRVYNKDFISDNLSFLVDDEGHISPIAIIGDDNTKIEQKISEKRNLLGSVEDKTGLRHAHEVKQQSYLKLKREKNKLEEALEKSLIDKANKKPNGIKHQTKFAVSNYNITSLKTDIKTVLGSNFLLNNDEKTRLENLVQDQQKSEINCLFNVSPIISQVLASANSLIGIQIKPSQPIQELLDDYLLQEWVKNGRQHHESKRKTCGFCGNDLPATLWIKLDAHFDQESESLEKKLQKKISEIKIELEHVTSDLSFELTDFYSELQKDAKSIKAKIKEEINKYKVQLNTINKALIKRQKNIFNSYSEIEVEDNSETILKLKDSLQTLVEKNNNKSSTLVKEQNEARRLLRLSEVAEFISVIDYSVSVKNISDKNSLLSQAKLAQDDAFDDINRVIKEIDELDASIKDEKKGADLVNKYLNNFFGHESLQLKASENKEKAYKFEIRRDKKEAHNLSEGECSLVAFCYFIAKLDDIDSKDKKLLIYIDDPISSLDNNHIFFVYSLIESILAKPIGKDAEDKNVFRYSQLFISTHNLDFLKYLKRLTKQKSQTQHFLVTGKSTGSELALMPPYMKNYVTEFNYLFSEIYRCSDEANAANNHESFYNFGNNLRKFLEAYLFFKYPFSSSDSRDHGERVTKFFGGEEGTDSLVQRLINEFSHLAERFDRSVQPIDHAEISKLAEFVLKKIEEKDPEQFEHLVQSIS
ncbi:MULTISPECIES: AAA family ATPase [unclassified Alteromonas]|uniref:AAA family ATPase n=1 Tax=unclassified Alteromonas TaxID=2614992 RepID=UPI0005097AAB|nr:MULTISPECIES: AAA family ATPase [unclassified Alteromonas]